MQSPGSGQEAGAGVAVEVCALRRQRANSPACTRGMSWAVRAAYAAPAVLEPPNPGSSQTRQGHGPPAATQQRDASARRRRLPPLPRQQ
eukprot:5651239-Alexandrium_andersonii.AAC.1